MSRLITCLLAVLFRATYAYNPDMLFGEIVDHAGFQFESHQVESHGYLLTLYRIPGSKEMADNRPRPPVFLQHGLFDSAFAWVVHHQYKAPAFLLSAAGYDVWLANSRGVGPSRNHTTLNPDLHEKTDKFWHFDWQDMGREDLPSLFRHITKVTKYHKIAVIAHQEGSSQVYAGMAANPNFFNDHISLFVNLGSVTKLTHTQDELLKFSSQKMQLIEEAEVLFDQREIFGPTWKRDRASIQFCNLLPLMCSVLETYTESYSQFDDRKSYLVYMGHYPASSPLRSLMHYAQILQQDRFQVYRHSYMSGNFRGAEIDVAAASQVPIGLFVGKSDTFATVDDSRELRDKLHEQLVHFEEVEGGQSTFLIGKDMAYFKRGVLILLAAFHPIEPAQEPETIENYRSYAQIDMSDQKYLELEDRTLRHKETLKFLHKNLIMYLQ